MGGIEGCRLVALQPQRLGDHPFGRHRPLPRAIDRQCCIARRKHGVGLGICAHVHPHQCRAQGTALRVKGDHGATGGGKTHRLNLTCVNSGLGDGPPGGSHQRLPPIFGVLFGPGAGGKAGFIRHGFLPKASAVQIINPRPQAFGAAICGQVIGHHSPLFQRPFQARLRHASSALAPYITAGPPPISTATSSASINPASSAP